MGRKDGGDKGTRGLRLLWGIVMISELDAKAVLDGGQAGAGGFGCVPAID